MDPEILTISDMKFRLSLLRKDIFRLLCLVRETSITDTIGNWTPRKPIQQNFTINPGSKPAMKIEED